MRHFLNGLGIGRTWDFVWARRSSRTKIFEVIVMVLVSVLSGIAVYKYQIYSNRADLRLLTRSNRSVWTVGFANDGDVPARDLLAHLHFPEPVLTHSQTPDVFTFAGQHINSNTLFSGQDDVTLHCEVVPAHRKYQVVFAFGDALNAPPDVDVTISNGRVLDH